MKFKNFVKLFISIIVCELAGVAGSIFTSSEIAGWYKGIRKPDFNPPGWIFGPAWTLLFVLMGISLYLVWVNKWEIRNKISVDKKEIWNPLSKRFFSGDWAKANIILIFATQLILNIIWSVIFFGMHRPDLAFFEVIMLWVAITFTIINFYRVSKKAAYLLLPYIVWVSFAAILNYTIWMLN